jgi:DNA invertase Pin-like site-specific DNA recombinase
MMKTARIYLRVSSEHQDLSRQESLVSDAQTAGYYVAGIYRETASGARADRPELLRMITDLQPGDVVIAEKIDRISRLPLKEAEQLIQSIREQGARLCIPGLVDLSELAESSEGITKIVIESMQTLLLRLALQMARDDYETRRERQQQGIALAKEKGKYKGRTSDKDRNQRIITLRQANLSIHSTADTLNCSISQVKRIWALHKKSIKAP